MEDHVEIAGDTLRVQCYAPKHYAKIANRVQRAKGQATWKAASAGPLQRQSYTIGLAGSTLKQAKRQLNAVPCKAATKKQGRKLLGQYFKTHAKPVVRTVNGKRLRGHALAVHLNAERSARALAADGGQNAKHLYRTKTDSTISLWYEQPNRTDIQGVDSKGRRAGKQVKKRR